MTPSSVGPDRPTHSQDSARWPPSWTWPTSATATPTRSWTSSAPEILRTLYNGDVGYDDLLDGICATADERYEWLVAYMKDPEMRRHSLDSALTPVGRWWPSPVAP